jgi:hypothetical protein
MKRLEMQNQHHQQQQEECARERDRAHETERESARAQKIACARALECEKDCRELRAHLSEIERARGIERARLGSELESSKEREQTLLSQEAFWKEKVSHVVRAAKEEGEKRATENEVPRLFRTLCCRRKSCVC